MRRVHAAEEEEQAKNGGRMLRVGIASRGLQKTLRCWQRSSGGAGVDRSEMNQEVGRGGQLTLGGHL